MRVEYDLDVLKPHNPDNWELAQVIMEIEGVTFVQIKTDEIDQKTTSVFLTVKGTGDLKLTNIKSTLEDMNCALHSVDRVQIDRRS